jgi:type 1 glutamine amidotransferase
MERTASLGSLLYLTDISPYAPVTGSNASSRIAGVHQSLGSSVLAIREMAELLGLPFKHFSDVRQILSRDIEQAQVLILYTIGDTPWSRDQKELILDKVRVGALGVVGLHSATDSAHSWPEYQRLVGARFASHPVTATLPIEVCDRTHSATAHLGSQWTLRDELYVFNDLRTDARVLLQARGGNIEALDDREGAAVFPLSWCFQEGEGRCFYTSLGHFVEAFEDSGYLRHLYGGLAWVLGA